MPTNKSEVPVSASNLEAYIKKYGGGSSESGSGSTVDPDNFWDINSFSKFYMGNPYTDLDTKTYIRTFMVPECDNSQRGNIAYGYHAMCFLSFDDLNGPDRAGYYAFLSSMYYTARYGNGGGLWGFYAPYLTAFPFSSSCMQISSIQCPEITYLPSLAFHNNLAFRVINTNDLPKLVDIGLGAFSYCQNLVSVHFSKIRNIGNYAFCSCSKLLNVILGDGLESAIGTIQIGAFNSCRSLQSLYLLNKYNLTSNFNDQFKYTNMASIYVPSSLYDYYSTNSFWKVGISRFVSF